MKKIDNILLESVITKAKASPRKRMNHNFHPELSDPVQRMLNAMERGTYIRPHKHRGKEEVFIALKGRLLAITFNDDGSVRDHYILDPQQGHFAVEMPEDTFHTVTSLEDGSVAYELKEGPYIPHPDEGIAQWTPAEGTPEAAIYINKLIEKYGKE